MAVLQHYYTSYVNEEKARVGFQVKAMSPGISASTQELLLRLIAYKIPSKLDEYALGTHPKALRYLYENPQEVVLLCSQSNGLDRNGRPGNFFAHSLVLEPEEFANTPPILYWGSTFWQSSDPEARPDEFLAPLEGLKKVEEALEVENVFQDTWQFLAQGQRCEQFRKLMAAVIHSNATRRRIVIIDDADNVVQWITALTLMLPPEYRHLLSFATYHHDPYQGQFMVTGTTSDSLFRASADEYSSYFILNTETGQISDVEPSAYADQAARAAQDYEYYETALLAVTMDYASHFPQPERIDETVDALALYGGLFEPQHGPALTSAEVQAVKRALDALERCPPGGLNLDELQSLEKLLQAASAHDADADQAHDRVIALHQKHGLAIDKSALRYLQLATTDLIKHANYQEHRDLVDRMRQRYGENIFLGTIHSPAYVQWLNQQVERASFEELRILWVYLGSSLAIGPNTRPFFLAILNAAEERWRQDSSPLRVEELFTELVDIIEEKHEIVSWLNLMVDSAAQLHEEALLLFYRHFVFPLDLDQRLSYRKIIRPLYPYIERDEMTYELALRDGPQALERLKAWISHAKNQRMNVQEFLEDGLECLEEYWAEQLPALSPTILNSAVLTPLPDGWEKKLLDLALSNVSFATTSRTEDDLYQKYKGRVTFAPEIEVIMAARLALKDGDLNSELASKLKQHFSQAKQRPHLRQEYASFIPDFLVHCKKNTAHGNMINALFPDWKRKDEFWTPYWDELTLLLTARETATTARNSADQAFKLLNFWFVVPVNFLTSPYTWHYFFLTLPQYLEQARKEKGFQDVARYAQEKQEQLNWYPLLQEYFSARKNILAAPVGQGLATLQKLLRNSEETKLQKGKEQGERTALQGQVSLLFSARNTRKVHQEKLSEIYQEEQRSLFWSFYGENFKELLYAGRTEDVFALLTFWFDEAADLFKKQSFMPQEFLLGLSTLLEEARKDRKSRASVRQIYTRGVKEQATYRWFFLVAPFFAEQERGFGLF